MTLRIAKYGTLQVSANSVDLTDFVFVSNDEDDSDETSEKESKEALHLLLEWVSWRLSDPERTVSVTHEDADSSNQWSQ